MVRLPEAEGVAGENKRVPSNDCSLPSLLSIKGEARA